MSRNHNFFTGLHRELVPPSNPTTYNARRNPATTTSPNLAFDVDVLGEAVGVASYPETLTERAAESPTPDFVQLRLIIQMTANYDTGGGTLTWAVSGPGSAYFPFSVTETVTGEGTFTYEDQIVPISAGNESSLLSTYLRRSPDGDTYELDPTNDGIDTLFPWDEFVADPAVAAGCVVSATNLETLVADDGNANGILIIARPWFRDVPLTSGGYMCVL